MTRSKLYYQPKPRSNEDEIIDKLLNIYEAHPVYGYRRMTASLRRQGIIINHKKVRKLMQMLNLKAIYPGPNTSARNHAEMAHRLSMSGTAGLCMAGFPVEHCQVCPNGALAFRPAYWLLRNACTHQRLLQIRLEHLHLMGLAC